MSPVKLGIIGCGIAARDLHWPALKQLQDQFEITVVCNHTPEKAAAYAELVGGVPYVTDYRRVLDQEGVEAVDIVLPIHLNHEVTLAAMDAGKHVIVEKPLAGTLAQAGDLNARASGCKEAMMVGENLRYHPLFKQVRSRIESGEIGTPHSIYWDIFYCVDRHNKYAATQWRIQHQYPGGFILDGGIHNIAAIRDMFGDIVAGTAFTRSINPAIGAIDRLDFHFMTSAGVDGTLSILASAVGLTESRLRILGDEGSIQIVGNRLQVIQAAGSIFEEMVETDGGYRAEFEDFYQAIRKGAAPVSSFAEAYRDLEVLVTALESSNPSHAFQV